MKKLIKSKLFLAGALALLSITILTVCLLWGAENKTEFIPDGSVPLTAFDSWTENAAPAIPNAEKTGNTEYGGNEGADAFRQATGNQVNIQPEHSLQPASGSAGEVITEFIAPLPPTQPPPDEPGTDLAEKPAEPPSSAASPRPAPPPSPGSANSSGEVYDPVFGWVKPGNVEQTDVDSEGDPNKIIGNMN